jgi:hypothetical protein
MILQRGEAKIPCPATAMDGGSAENAGAVFPPNKDQHYVML